MPFALILALVASLGFHAAALFGTDFNLSIEPEPRPLVAELKPMEKSTAQPAAVNKRERQAAAHPSAAQRKSDAPVTNGKGEASDLPPPSAEAAPTAPSEPSPSTVITSRLPEHGKISYRVDRGDMNFEIGVSNQDWEIVDRHYRLLSVVETTGLVSVFKAYRIEMESRGQMTAEGFRPESFFIRRNGKETDEKALFDWDKMMVRVGGQAEQALDLGAQDLLSFNYQLGYLPNLSTGSRLSIATGRKYGAYALEVLGDEEIDVPAGRLRTLHVRAPGVNTTELWLAYEYLLLPVKIRHVDSKGGSLVQVATTIEVSPK